MRWMRRCFWVTLEVSVFVAIGMVMSSVADGQRALSEKVGFQTAKTHWFRANETLPREAKKRFDRSRPAIVLVVQRRRHAGNVGTPARRYLGKKNPKLKVLYNAGYTRNAIVHNGIPGPGTQLLSKPFSLEDLAQKVRSILDDPA
ncbi:hypothetical protein [Mesorhizobium sp. NZP2077]|uniref:hypothetical protein n=1 Tax=Mesorhizobium sp. NZP2077 TaxID=2483404 RepID=UPI001FEF69A9|nr:hypothetical protein [Mesorhizobium sp. NZP2077]